VEARLERSVGEEANPVAFPTREGPLNPDVIAFRLVEFVLGDALKKESAFGAERLHRNDFFFRRVVEYHHVDFRSGEARFRRGGNSFENGVQ
jgi:hypothetical protein